MKESKGAQEIQKTKLLIENWEKKVNQNEGIYLGNYHSNDPDAPDEQKYNDEFKLYLDPPHGYLAAKVYDNYEGYYTYYIVEELMNYFPNEKDKLNYIKQIENAAKSNPNILNDKNVLDNVENMLYMFMERETPDFGDHPEYEEPPHPED